VEKVESLVNPRKRLFMENEPQACEPQAAARQEDDGRWRKGSPWQLAGFTLLISVAITGIFALIFGIHSIDSVLSVFSVTGILAGMSAIIAWNVKRSQWMEYLVLLVLIGIVVIGGLTLLGGKVSVVYSYHHYNYLERNYNRNYNCWVNPPAREYNNPPAREYNEADKSRSYLPLIRK
jgi:hypothetical protein